VITGLQNVCRLESPISVCQPGANSILHAADLTHLQHESLKKELRLRSRSASAPAHQGSYLNFGCSSSEHQSTRCGAVVKNALTRRPLFTLTPLNARTKPNQVGAHLTTTRLFLPSSPSPALNASTVAVALKSVLSFQHPKATTVAVQHSFNAALTCSDDGPYIPYDTAPVALIPASTRTTKQTHIISRPWQISCLSCAAMERHN
jgi:hypothetical protein